MHPEVSYRSKSEGLLRALVTQRQMHHQKSSLVWAMPHERSVQELPVHPPLLGRIPVPQKLSVAFITSGTSLQNPSTLGSLNFISFS